jgi:NAD(P)-dependent dehydrogenase (short-subunit alcohol dehydrogenase family)
MVSGEEASIDPHEFEGNRVLVTCGSNGIGRALVARLREGRASVLATAVRCQTTLLMQVHSFPGDWHPSDLTYSPGIGASARARRFPVATRCSASFM